AVISGSSAATTNAIGKITLGELEQRGYPKSISMGSLAGAGTFGFLIPPSIIMIVYGVLSQTSVLKLFAAGIIPSLILAAMFMGYLAVYSWVKPFKITVEKSDNLWKECFSRLPTLLPFLVLMVVLMGSMYSGLASPS